MNGGAMWDDRRRRREEKVREGWQISEVERLVGLTRRDIQRACYEGEGGAGILEVADSTWGKRSYSAGELAVLYHVRLRRDEGLTLPEVSRLFERARGGEGGWGRFAGDMTERLGDAHDEATERLVCARSLAAATAAEDGGADVAALDAAVWEMLVWGATSLARGEMQPARSALLWLAGEGGERLKALWRELAGLRQAGEGPAGPRAQAEIERALGGGAGEDAGGSESSAGEMTRGLFATLLDSPGAELAIELRLGPGGFAFLEEALAAGMR